MNTPPNDTADWNSLRENSLALFGLTSLRSDEVEGHFSADLDGGEFELLARFAKADQLTDDERQSLIGLLRQNRTAMEALKDLVTDPGSAET